MDFQALYRNVCQRGTADTPTSPGFLSGSKSIVSETFFQNIAAIHYNFRSANNQEEAFLFPGPLPASSINIFKRCKNPVENS